MTRIWLCRHGAHDWLSKSLVGRAPGISINAQGRREAEVIAEALASVPLSAIYSSPMERALQTALPLSASRGIEVRIHEGLNEIDFGDWTSLTFDRLSDDSQWHQWNAARAGGRTPGGESMRDVELRIALTLQQLAGSHTGEDIALFSHGDVIKAALCWILGMSLDSIHTLDVGPGGVAVLELVDGSSAVRALKRNEDLFEDGVCTIPHLIQQWNARSPADSRRGSDEALARTAA